MKDEARYHHSSERSRNQISGCPVVTPEKRGYCDEDCQVLTSLFWTHQKSSNFENKQTCREETEKMMDIPIPRT